MIQAGALLKGVAFIPKDKVCRSVRDFEICLSISHRYIWCSGEAEMLLGLQQ